MRFRNPTVIETAAFRRFVQAIQLVDARRPILNEFPGRKLVNKMTGIPEMQAPLQFRG